MTTTTSQPVTIHRLDESDVATYTAGPWRVPPECQGQIVEHAYSADWESGSGVILLRVTDQSIVGPGRVSYYAAEASLLKERGDGTPDFEPWNREPQIDSSDWTECRVDEEEG